ncbi:DUF6670 family protein [Amycolatopsis japonica]|uniref:DUF6670 family protein n=1 Tax=Amycolatopsis japonica TaxID=208439 RepID=UPI003319C45E
MEHRTAGLLRKAAPVLVDRILPRLDHRIEGSRRPSPLRYLNTMTFIGATGTVLSSTAAPGHHHYRAYDTRTDYRFAADGSRLAWGEDLSLLATYRGTVTDGAERVEVDGLCTVEYARCVTPQALFNLDERTQLLLTDVRAAGATACRLAHLRTSDGCSRTSRSR